MSTDQSHGSTVDVLHEQRVEDLVAQFVESLYGACPELQGITVTLLRGPQPRKCFVYVSPVNGHRMADVVRDTYAQNIEALQHSDAQQDWLVHRRGHSRPRAPAHHRVRS